jgi:hypothetical protein
MFRPGPQLEYCVHSGRWTNAVEKGRVGRTSEMIPWRLGDGRIIRVAQIERSGDADRTLDDERTAGSNAVAAFGQSSDSAVHQVRDAENSYIPAMPAPL